MHRHDKFSWSSSACIPVMQSLRIPLVRRSTKLLVFPNCPFYHILIRKSKFCGFCLKLLGTTYHLTSSSQSRRTSRWRRIVPRQPLLGSRAVQKNDFDGTDQFLQQLLLGSRAVQKKTSMVQTNFFGSCSSVVELSRRLRWYRPISSAAAPR
jgi:hypothetical protein